MIALVAVLDCQGQTGRPTDQTRQIITSLLLKSTQENRSNFVPLLRLPGRSRILPWTKEMGPGIPKILNTAEPGPVYPLEIIRTSEPKILDVT
jgi:hypothetical protein